MVRENKTKEQICLHCFFLQMPCMETLFHLTLTSLLQLSFHLKKKKKKKKEKAKYICSFNGMIGNNLILRSKEIFCRDTCLITTFEPE